MKTFILHLKTFIDLAVSSSSRLTHVRKPKDIDTMEINGIAMVVANGKGISLSTKGRLDKTRLSGWVWKISRGTQMPTGLKLINDRSGHYSICLRSNMPLDEFIGLLSKLALKCQKVFKKEVN